MRKMIVILAVALAMVVALPAGATPLNGSLVLGALGATINGTNLANSTLFSPVVFSPGEVLAGISTGDYTNIPFVTFGSGGVIDTTSMSTFVVDFPGYGKFVAASGIVVSQSANFIDAYYLGDFIIEAGGAMDGLGIDMVSPTSARISLNKTGAAVSYAGTLASPPASIVPEPGTYALMGAGLLSLLAIRRKRS